MSSIDINRSVDYLPPIPNESTNHNSHHLPPPPPNTTTTNNSYNKFPAAATKKNHFLDLLKSRFLISVVIVSAVFITLLCIGLVVVYEKENDVTHSIDAWKDKLSIEQSEWYDSGLDELKIALQTKTNSRRAKNVILFVGDGMGPNTVTASRIYKHGEEGLLEWEKFPHMGLLKVYFILLLCCCC